MKHRTRAELVAHLGLPAGTYTNWKLGRSRNFCEYLETIVEYLAVDATWLLTGEVLKGTVNYREQELLEAFRRLSEERQTLILKNAKWLVE